MERVGLSRRDLLTRAGWAAALAASGGLLASCRSSPGPSADPSANKKVALPAYLPAELVKPDLPATTAGLMAGYFSYPASPVAAFDEPPAAGLNEVKALTNMFQPIPPAAGGNRYWQAIDKALGTKLDLTMTPAADYPNKLATTLASGDLPDIMLITTTVARRADVLQRLCADLTEFVSGDAAKEFPFLANIPTDSWRSMVYRGGIYAIPIPRAVVGTIMFSRDDLIERRGLSPAPADYAGFVELAKGLTDARAGRWAFGNTAGVVTFVSQMLGTPTDWALRSGKFVSEVETEERKKAISLVADLYKQGVFHPDSVGGNLQLRDLFGAGTIALNPDGYAAWDLLADTYSVDVGGIVAPGFSGGKAIARAGGASFGLTAFKKGSPDRIRALLRLCDWLAAPLGSREYMLRKFGVEGVHYTLKDGVPAFTAAGKSEVKLPLEYICDSPDVLGPGSETRVRKQRAYQETVIPRLQRSAAEGLYSETAVNKAGQLKTLLDNAQLDVVAGRKPLSSWDEAVADWRKAGGDQIRSEYEAAAEAAA